MILNDLNMIWCVPNRNDKGYYLTPTTSMLLSKTTYPFTKDENRMEYSYYLGNVEDSFRTKRKTETYNKFGSLTINNTKNSPFLKERLHFLTDTTTIENALKWLLDKFNPKINVQKEGNGYFIFLTEGLKSIEIFTPESYNKYITDNGMENGLETAKDLAVRFAVMELLGVYE